MPFAAGRQKNRSGGKNVPAGWRSKWHGQFSTTEWPALQDSTGGHRPPAWAYASNGPTWTRPVVVWLMTRQCWPAKLSVRVRAPKRALLRQEHLKLLWWPTAAAGTSYL